MVDLADDCTIRSCLLSNFVMIGFEFIFKKVDQFMHLKNIYFRERMVNYEVL